MFFPEQRMRVWLYAKPTDMRKQFDGLAALARHQLGEDPMSGHLFVFINRRKTHMKVLYFDRGGYCMWCKRLERGQFNYAAELGEKQTLSWVDLQLLLAGVKVQKSRQYRRFQRPEPALVRYNNDHAASLSACTDQPAAIR
jgi:transposase